MLICGTQKIDITNRQIQNALHAGIDKIGIYQFLYFDKLDKGRIGEVLAKRTFLPDFVQLDCEYPTNLPASEVLDEIQAAKVQFESIYEIEAALGEEIPIEIYSRYSWWKQYTGDSELFNHLRLNYAHYDGIENFSDWPSVSFGNWPIENIWMKQIAENQHVAGILCDLEVYRE